MLRVLGVEPTPRLVADLDGPVDPRAVVEPFPEVTEVLDTLRSRGVRMAVVSDAWPQLPELHAGVGLSGYFEVYAISAVLGCTKPDPRMYRHASDGLGLTPDQCLFVDDDPRLVEAAMALGYQGCAVLRDGSHWADVPSITDLRGLLSELE
jgi:putative hydrolase of the HAD superfamily